MRLLMINPKPDLTSDEFDRLKKDLGTAIREGVVLTHPSLISYEVVEFDSIEFDYPKRNDGHKILKEYLKQKTARSNYKSMKKDYEESSDYMNKVREMAKEELKNNDNSGNGEEDSRSGEEA